MSTMWVERGESRDLLCEKILLYFILLRCFAYQRAWCQFFHVTYDYSFVYEQIIDRRREEKCLFIYGSRIAQKQFFFSFFSWRGDKRISRTPLRRAHAIIIQSFCLRQQIARETVLRRKSQILMFINKQSRRKDFNWTKLLNGAKNWSFTIEPRWITSGVNWIAERRGSGEQQENIMREESLTKCSA